MRTQSLRQAANRYLKMDKGGSIKDKKHRTFVIHKLIDDLFIIGAVPPSWEGLKHQHIRQLIKHWEKRKIKPATMMDYMTTIRAFLKDVNCFLSDIDNQSLGLSRQYPLIKKKKINPDIWTTFTEPVARLLMALQIQFGLTFGEALHLIPEIHTQKNALWITREIAFNSEDRSIPFRNENQKNIFEELTDYTKGHQCLEKVHHCDDIRAYWRMALISKKLPLNRSFRYLYAQYLKKELLPILGSYQTNWLIRDEMGIKSRNSLWLYLNE